MRNQDNEQERSGLLIGSEPLKGVRSASKQDDNDAGKDKPLGDSDDSSDSDKTDSDTTDKGDDKGDDRRDADGRD